MISAEVTKIKMITEPMLPDHRANEPLGHDCFLQYIAKFCQSNISGYHTIHILKHSDTDFSKIHEIRNVPRPKGSLIGHSKIKKLIWQNCRDPGSNRGPLDLQSNALPTELSRPHMNNISQ